MTAKSKTDAILFALGATGYSAIELLWRGRTHWTMGLTGGACVLAMHHINGRMQGRPLWSRCVAGGAFTNAKNLQTVKIGACTSIGSLAFGFNSALQTVELDNCASIGSSAFQAAGAPIAELHIRNCTIEEAAF